MIEKPARIIRNQFDRLSRLIFWLFIVLILIQIVVFVTVINFIWGESFEMWLYELLIATAFLVAGALITLAVIRNTRRKNIRLLQQSIARELQPLESARSQIAALQAMASTVGASLNSERVLDAALEVCFLAMKAQAAETTQEIGVVLLIEGENLTPAVTKGFVARDQDQNLVGHAGILAKSLKQAEPIVTHQPDRDPELLNFVSFQECQTVVCVPMRAGFHVYGLIVLGVDQHLTFVDEELDFFTAVANQAVVAIQNSNLKKDLSEQKGKFIDAEEIERRALVSTLHDGLAQRIAAVAMRIALVRSLMIRDASQALNELKKVENSARLASKDIRDVLFTLRPMNLKGKNLAQAIEMTIDQAREDRGPVIDFAGLELANLLDDEAQMVAFYIVEEALNNIKKHARANSVNVRLWREEEWIALQVKDDGIGFDLKKFKDENKNSEKLGLLFMRQRSRRIDGLLRVSTGPGQGTIVSLLVPLDKNSR